MMGVLYTMRKDVDPRDGGWENPRDDRDRETGRLRLQVETSGIGDKHQELEEAGRGLRPRLQREGGPPDNLVSDCERIHLCYKPPSL